nr:PAS domain-containing protein [Neobacillus sp. Marseille-Q6967]
MTDKSNLEILNRIDLFFELFNNMRDLVFLTKVDSAENFSYVLANRPAKDLCGLTDESFGKPLNEVLPQKAYELIKSKYKDAMRKKEPITYEDQLIVPPSWANLENYKYSPNQIIYWESTITPVFNQHEACTHFLAIVRDITDRRLKRKGVKENQPSKGTGKKYLPFLSIKKPAQYLERPR